MEVKECEELEDNEGLPVNEKNNNEKETWEKDVMDEVIGQPKMLFKIMGRS